MKSVVHYVKWSSTLLVLIMACYLGIVHAQEQEWGEPLTPPGNQGG